MSKRIKQALDLARTVITDKIETIEESCCFHERGRPLIETMDVAAKPDYRRSLRAVALIDEALKEIEPCG